MKTCYYELLGVESDANDQELKKAYRKKALQLHPDKNRDDVEAATARFALVRAAYEVLSDPQERSWYDSHKSSILRDDDEFEAGGEYHTEEMIIPSTSPEEIMRYFNPSLYTNFDTQQGFYYIVSMLFEKLAREEVIHGKSQNLPKFDKYKDDDPNVNVIDESLLLYARFGNSGSDYTSQVRSFYSVWSSFLSVKSFNWKDEYRYSAAPDRRTRRLMERENKKARDAAKKEYNETVRSFVSFIKKRDPRVKAGLSEFEKSKKKKRQQEIEEQARVVKQEQKLRSMMNNQNNYTEQDWQQLSVKEIEDLENLLNEEYDISSASDSDSEYDEFDNPLDEEINQDFECIICNKIFKNKNQFDVHESSNKHKKLLKKLQWEMKKEGIALGLDKEDIDLDEFETASSGFNSADEYSDERNDDNNDEASNEADPQVKEQPVPVEEPSKDTQINYEDFEIDDEIEGIEDLEIETLASLSKSSKKSKKSKKTNNLKVSDDNDESKNILDEELTKLAKGIKLEDSDDDDWGLTNKKKAKKNKKKLKESSAEPAALPPPHESESSQEAKVVSQSISNGAEKCAVCNGIFTSRNKLFQHVKSTGHAAPVKGVKGKKSKKSR